MADFSYSVTPALAPNALNALRLKLLSLDHARVVHTGVEGVPVRLGYCADVNDFDVESTAYEALRGPAADWNSELLASPPKQLRSWRLSPGDCWPVTCAEPTAQARYGVFLFLHRAWEPVHGGNVVFSNAKDGGSRALVFPRPNTLLAYRVNPDRAPKLRAVSRTCASFALLHWYVEGR